MVERFYSIVKNTLFDTKHWTSKIRTQFWHYVQRTLSFNNNNNDNNT